jgi:uncharacterized protein
MNYNKLFILITLFFIVSNINAQVKKTFNWKNEQVLVYTKNGKGYVHDNIPFAVACIQKLGKEHGFKVDVADTALVFTRENLKKYKMLIFTSTNNDVFENDEQRLVFRHYIEAGGGFVGIHSVVGTERNWTWFKQLLGGTFSWHAHFQKYKVAVIDAKHPSVQGIPKEWEIEDECYFEKEMYPGIHTIMAQDVKTLKANDEKEANLIKQNNGSFGNFFPAVWHHFFDGGVAWVTTLGHDKNVYSDALYVKHIFQGMQFVAENTSKLDFKKAYSENRDSAVK